MGEKKIVVLGTGGTIAGTAINAADNIGYQAAQLGVDQLVAAIPPLRARALVVEQVAQLDSKDMDNAVWLALAQRCLYWMAQDDVQGVVVTHGTDTLEETAFFLHAVLAPAKPVVLTCAMRPASALVPDGPQNLLDAVALAATPGASGVLAVCAGHVHGAVDVQKIHSYQVDAFHSGDAGPFGHMEEGRLRRLRAWPVAGDDGAAGRIQRLASLPAWPRVEIVTSHAGASAATVHALLSQRVDGLVVAGTGNGTTHQALLPALDEACAAGVRVWRSTRCAFGRVLAPAGAGGPEATTLTPVKARIALQLSLAGVSTGLPHVGDTATN